MIKIKNRRKRWLLRGQKNASAKSLRLAGLARHYLYRTGFRVTRLVPIMIVRLPPALLSETEEHREKIAECIDKATNALKSGQRVRLDFTGTKKAYPGGMLMLLAYVELMLEIYPTRLTAVSPPGSIIAQLLVHFGFADRLCMRCAGTKATHESVINWRFLTGTQADGPKIASLLQSLKAVSNSDMPEGLYDVLAEALTNVRQHAYPPSNQELPKNLQKWWLFSKYAAPTTEKPGNLYIGIYDIGVGIQASLRQKLKAGEVILDKTDDVLKLLKLGDGTNIERLLLKRAVEETRSSTGHGFRGNGLPEMREFVLGTTSGRLYITSGGAQYSCIAATKKSDAFGCNRSFQGTMILWSIPLGMSPEELKK